MTLVPSVLPSKMTSFPAVYNSSFRSMSESSGAAAKALWQLDKHPSVYALLFTPAAAAATATPPPHSQRRLAKLKKNLHRHTDGWRRRRWWWEGGDIRSSSARPPPICWPSPSPNASTPQLCVETLPLGCDAQPPFRGRRRKKEIKRTAWSSLFNNKSSDFFLFLGSEGRIQTNPPRPPLRIAD